ncbi:MAG: glutamate ligase domain-containing protein [Clostridia bacterium]
MRRHILDRKDIKLRGIHNYENICAALAATSSLVDIQTQIEAIKAFNGVEHRLEFVKEIEGVKWYNDSIGTSPASTISGLKAFDENIILIAGGSDKGLDYTQVGEMIAQKVGILILIGVTASKIEEATQNALTKIGKNIPIYHGDTFEEAVYLAKEKAKKGDVVLLSPASASFDMFKNFAQRGEKFKDLVNTF